MLKPVTKTIILLLPFVLPLGLALDMYIPAVPSMAQSLGALPTEIQLTLSIFLYCFGLGQLFFGPLSDSIGRKRTLLISALVFTLGGILCFFAHTVNSLIVGRVLQAFGACGTQVVAFAMIRDQYEGKNATVVFSTLKAVSAIAPLAAPILGAFLQIHYGWRATFIILSLYGLLILGLSLGGIKETLQKYEPFQVKAIYLPAFKNALSQGRFLYYCVCVMAAQAAMFGYFSLSPHFFIGKHSLSETQFATLFGINAFFFLITGAIMGKKIYKIGIRKSTLIAAILFGISGISMGIGHYIFDGYQILFLPNLIASSGAAIMLGAATSGALLPFKTHIGITAALLGCIEFMGGGLIGSISLMGHPLSVQALSLILMFLGGSIVLLNFFYRQQIEVEHLSTLPNLNFSDN